jgi:Resolvase, N terminal domain
MAVIGYARVSTTDQNPQLQLDALHEARATRVFTGHRVSGATACRPELDACLDHLREGDVLTVWKLDRLGRNTQHVLAVVDQLTSRGIGFRSLTEGLHTEGPMGKAMLTIMAAFAQLERDAMIERTRAGLIAAAWTGARADARAKLTTPMPPKPVSSGRRASRPLTSRRCWVSPCHRVSLPLRGCAAREVIAVAVLVWEPTRSCPSSLPSPPPAG